MSMKREAVLHIPLSQYAFAERRAERRRTEQADGNTAPGCADAEKRGRGSGSESDAYLLTVRIRTGKNDIGKCILFYGDRVDPEEPVRMTEVPMKRTGSDGLFDYFECSFVPPFTRICYYFLLDDGKETAYYYSRGFCGLMDCPRTEYFQFPYIRREDVPQIPDWAKETVMYHIFPDSFASGKRRLERGSASGSPSRLGGTLAGITANLDYLEGLGINCIYLNPVFAAASYHRYDTADYFSLDPDFGTEKELRDLVGKCHAAGIRVILDGVFNHCGPDFFAFRDVLKNGESSRYRDWFYRMEFPLRFQDPPGYEAFAYVKEMPKLNTGNPEVADYLCRVGTYWIERADIDGWRLDVANEIDHEFWRKFRRAVRAVKPDCFLIAEIWEDAQIWLLGDQFDSSMNYTFSYLCRDFFGRRRLSAEEFDGQIRRMILRYPRSVSLAQMNFLDTHDVPRFLSGCGGDVRRLKLALFYLFMGYGIPSVFYGDECFMDGTTEDQYRAAMDWKKAESGCASDIALWIAARRSHPALTEGSYETILAERADGLYVFARSCGEERLLICVNNSDRERRLCLSELCGIGGRARDIISGGEAGEEIRLEAVSGRVFALL